MTPQEQLRLLRASKDENLPASKQLQIMRAIKTGEGDIDSILGTSGEQTNPLGMRSAKSFEELGSSSQEADKDEQMFDYETGAGGGLRAKLSFMETAEEKENLLRKLVGEDGFTKDAGGRLALTELGQISQGYDYGGKNLVIEDEGFSFGDVADLAGLVPETAGAVIGGILGAPGLVTGAAGAAAGAAVGQSAEEYIESLLGLQTQTGMEVAKDVAREAALAGTFDFAGNLIFTAGKAVIGLAGRGAKAGTAAGQATEAQQAAGLRALRILDEGGLPGAEAAGFGSVTSRLSATSRNISGSEDQAVRNIFFARSQKDKLLEDAGVANIDEVAEVIKNSAPEKAARLNKSLLDAQKLAMQAVEDGFEVVSKSINEGIDVGDDLLVQLVGGYDNFVKAADEWYKGVDNTLSKISKPITIGRGASRRTITQEGGELPIFDISHLKTQYDDVISIDYDGVAELAPEAFSNFGNVLKKLNANTADGSKKGFTSYRGLRSFRKNINDALYDRSMGIGNTTERKLLAEMRDSVDQMMQGGLPLTVKGLTETEGKIITKALKNHKIAQANYAKEIKVQEKLEKLNILRNVGEAGKNVKLVAGQNFDAIIAKPDRIKAVLEAVKRNSKLSGVEDGSEGVRRSLARKYLDDALADANKDSLDPTSFNGVKFYESIKKINKSGVGKELFGEDWGQVQSLAKSVSFNGIKKIDESIMQKIIQQNPGDDVVITLKSVLDAQVDLQKSQASKVLTDLSRGALDAEDAAIAILNPNIGNSQIKSILQFFESDPIAKKTIQDAVLRNVLGSVDDKIFISEAAASSLRNAIDSYKPGVLKTVLGKEKMEGLEQLADDLVFLKDTGGRGAGALAAEAIRTGLITSPMKNTAKVGRFKLLDRLINSPDTMRRSLELRTGAKTPEQVSNAIAMQLNEVAARSTGSQVPMTDSAAQIGQRIGSGLGAINRAKSAAKQGGIRAFLDDQESRGTRSPLMDIPEVSQPMLPEVTIGNRLKQNNAQQKMRQEMSLRERAKSNPYVASTLLGGLGSAGLL